MKRRTFVRNSMLLGAAAGFVPASLIASPKAATNKLPKWKGFNLRDFNSPLAGNSTFVTAEQHLQWMAGWGFDFIRLPIAYPFYLNPEISSPITPDDVYRVHEPAIQKIENLVYLAHKHGLHVSLNLHRAPGYCINAGFHEPYNLWRDKPAREAFNFHWNLWAKRFRNISREKISFDLLNEPSFREDMNDQHSRHSTIPAALYHEVAKGAVEAIRRENADHLVIADGNNVGNDPVPELRDLNIAQSCRGYFPHQISHYKAPWANKDPDRLPEPKYPGLNGKQQHDRAALEKYYQPWIDLMRSGVGVHCGECGAWNKTPHDVFLRWFSDVTEVLSGNGIGFALWEFIGDFGILNSGRTDVKYEQWHGYQLDKKLLDLCRSR